MKCNILFRTVFPLAMMGVSGAASAQGMSEAFTGGYAGGAAGAVDHHFVLEESVQQGGVTTTRRFNVTQWGVGGELFAGYDLALTNRMTIGGEAQFEFGGRSAIERNGSYTFGVKPRYGLSASARLGYLATPKLLAYAGGGYGVHEYRTIAQGNAAAGLGHSLDHTRSFILRGGLQFAATRRTHVRLEFEHLDGSRNQFMLGVPFRF